MEALEIQHIKFESKYKFVERSLNIEYIQTIIPKLNKLQEIYISVDFEIPKCHSLVCLDFFGRELNYNIEQSIINNPQITKLDYIEIPYYKEESACKIFAKLHNITDVNLILSNYQYTKLYNKIERNNSIKIMSIYISDTYCPLQTDMIFNTISNMPQLEKLEYYLNYSNNIEISKIYDYLPELHLNKFKFRMKDNKEGDFLNYIELENNCLYINYGYDFYIPEYVKHIYKYISEKHGLVEFEILFKFNATDLESIYLFVSKYMTKYTNKKYKITYYIHFDDINQETNYVYSKIDNNKFYLKYVYEKFDPKYNIEISKIYDYLPILQKFNKLLFIIQDKKVSGYINYIELEDNRLNIKYGYEHENPKEVEHIYQYISKKHVVDEFKILFEYYATDLDSMYRFVSKYMTKFVNKKYSITYGIHFDDKISYVTSVIQNNSLEINYVYECYNPIITDQIYNIIMNMGCIDLVNIELERKIDKEYNEIEDYLKYHNIFKRTIKNLYCKLSYDHNVISENRMITEAKPKYDDFEYQYIIK